MMTSTAWLRGLTALSLVFASAGLAACVSTDLPLGDAPMGQAGTGNAAGTGGAANTGNGMGGSAANGASDAGAAQSAEACSPLDPVTSTVVLSASDIVDAGEDTDGTVYVLTETDSALRLFVGTSDNLQEEFEAGTSQGNDGTTQFWTLQYSSADGSAVTVEVQQDSSGKRMGVVKGPISGKGFDVGTVGSVLSAITPAVAAAIPATSTQTFHIEYTGSYIGSDSPFTTVFLTAPDQPVSFDKFRLFLGTVDMLTEFKVDNVNRTLGIPSVTIVDFIIPDASLTGSPSQLTYESGSQDATLSTGTDSVWQFHGPDDFSVPTGAAFFCFDDR